MWIGILWYCVNVRRNMKYWAATELEVWKTRKYWKLWFCLFFVCFEDIFWVFKEASFKSKQQTEGCCENSIEIYLDPNKQKMMDILKGYYQMIWK